MLPWNAIVLVTLALANGVFIMKQKGFEMRHKNNHCDGAIENSIFLKNVQSVFSCVVGQRNGRVAHHSDCSAFFHLRWWGEGNLWNENENTMRVLKLLQTPWSTWWVNLDNKQCIRKAYRLCSAWRGVRREPSLMPPKKHIKTKPKKPVRLFLGYFESKQSSMHLALIGCFLRGRKPNLLILVE